MIQPIKRILRGIIKQTHIIVILLAIQVVQILRPVKLVQTVSNVIILSALVPQIQKNVTLLQNQKYQYKFHTQNL